MAEIKLGSLILGMDRSKKGGKIIPRRIVDVEGFLYNKKLLRKDFQLSSTSSLCDNCRKRTIIEVIKCSSSSPEEGPTTEGGSGGGW